ncbi:MAG TPA: hypothetical protein VF242_02255 [Nitrososphaeraceae archaeon]
MSRLWPSYDVIDYFVCDYDLNSTNYLVIKINYLVNTNGDITFFDEYLDKYRRLWSLWCFD